MDSKKLLAIETSGKICSVALCAFDVIPATNADLLSHINSINFEIIAEYNIHLGNRHDKYCAELCRRILQDNETSMAGIDGVAVSAGPGSFTGLRIGMSVAKGLCFDTLCTTENSDLDTREEHASTTQLLAVPTLSAIAWEGLSCISGCAPVFNSQLNYDFLAVIPSHANLFYHQLFDKNGEVKSEISFSEINSLVALFGNKNVYLGTNYKTKLDFGLYLPQMQSLTAASIAKMGAIQYIKEQFADATKIQPFYIQDFMPRAQPTDK